MDVYELIIYKFEETVLRLENTKKRYAIISIRQNNIRRFDALESRVS